MGGAGLWSRWVAANAIGEFLGLAPVAFIGLLAARILVEAGGAEAAFGGLALFTLLGAFEGAVIGLAQWLVLRRPLPGIARRSWVLATTLGAMAAWFLGTLPNTVLTLSETRGGAAPGFDGTVGYAEAALMGGLLGTVLALPQWRVLRRHLDSAAWWMPANTAAWAVALPLVVLFGGMPVPEDGLAPLLAIVAAVIAGTGALVGAIHGAVLVRLLLGRSRG